MTPHAKKRLPKTARLELRRRLRQLIKAEAARGRTRLVATGLAGDRRRQSRTGTDAAFADFVGTSPRTLSDWLTNKSEPSVPQLVLLAERTGVSLDWLLLGAGGPQPVYRGQSRTDAELERDFEVQLRREVAIRLEDSDDLRLKGVTADELQADARRVLGSTYEREASECAAAISRFLDRMSHQAHVIGAVMELVRIDSGDVSSPESSVHHATALAERVANGLKAAAEVPSRPAVFLSQRQMAEIEEQMLGEAQVVLAAIGRAVRLKGTPPGLRRLSGSAAWSGLLGPGAGPVDNRGPTQRSPLLSDRPKNAFDGLVAKPADQAKGVGAQGAPITPHPPSKRKK